MKTGARRGGARRHAPRGFVWGVAFSAALAAGACAGASEDRAELSENTSSVPAGTKDSSSVPPPPGSSESAAPLPTEADGAAVTPATAAPASSASDAPAATTTRAAPLVTPAPTAETDAPQPEASTLDELLELGRPIVIAHAGGDQDYPHSTLYAYANAAAAGADVLELDVQLTADGVLIVQHDDTVDRTTEATGPVADLTLAEIQALDSAYWFVPGLWGDQSRPDPDYVWRGVRTGAVAPPPGFGPEDFKVPAFYEVAQRFPNHVLDVEIKLQRGPDGEEDPATGIAAARVLASEIARLRREDSVIVACFNDEVLSAFNRLAPEVLTSPGLEAMLGWYLAGEALDPRYRVLQAPYTYEGIEVVQPEVVEKVESEGRVMWVWLSGTDVLETQSFYSDLLGRGAHGVIAGRPAAAVLALRNR